ncbi:LLM class flavin-dependent oxidoreductase [Sphingobium amiense]|uniref:LLM class flavin-dependent oxidoreductase n=1 Tax=Sphingobium amiense TaxID=135719 RepID=A0A494WFN0_9SPHN|nr:NtaA/DmoA family FMN-dependent monooxygenase [Sphingobium amiense]BBD99675.1 LLM class flavin-dependent oxidoreductase [Sphingobium amiense]
MSKMLHMAFFSQAGNGNANRAGSWMRTVDGYDWRYPELHQDIGRAAERAKFDMVFYADALAAPMVYRGSFDYYARAGIMMPVHDPIPIMGVLAAATNRIGLVSTISTSFYPPFMAARVLSTLDHLSRGRTGWNIVTSVQKNAAENLGLDDLPPHDTRYDIAEEYLDLCRKLWDSWDVDAMVMDRASGVLADPTKIHAANFVGEHFKSRGPLNISRSPQGYPVIASAGQSPRAIRFAGKQSEITIFAKRTISEIKAFTSEVRAQAVASGRDVRSCKIFNVIQPFIGETASIAQERYAAFLEGIEVKSVLASMSDGLGFDLSTLDADKPIPPEAFEGSNAMPHAFRNYYKDGAKPTLGDIARDIRGKYLLTPVGTPDDVLDIMEETAREGDLDGFFLEYAITDYAAFVEFVDKVVPRAQQRGMMRREYTGTTLRHHLNEF